MSRALDRAGFKIIASGVRQCVKAEENGEEPTVAVAQLEKLFLSLPDSSARLQVTSDQEDGASGVPDHGAAH